jgi:hypothetical protein
MAINIQRGPWGEHAQTVDSLVTRVLDEQRYQEKLTYERGQDIQNRERQDRMDAVAGLSQVNTMIKDISLAQQKITVKSPLVRKILGTNYDAISAQLLTNIELGAGYDEIQSKIAGFAETGKWTEARAEVPKLPKSLQVEAFKDIQTFEESATRMAASRAGTASTVHGALWSSPEYQLAVQKTDAFYKEYEARNKAENPYGDDDKAKAIRDEILAKYPEMRGNPASLTIGVINKFMDITPDIPKKLDVGSIFNTIRDDIKAGNVTGYTEIGDLTPEDYTTIQGLNAGLKDVSYDTFMSYRKPKTTTFSPNNFNVQGGKLYNRSESRVATQTEIEQYDNWKATQKEVTAKGTPLQNAIDESGGILTLKKGGTRFEIEGGVQSPGIGRDYIVAYKLDADGNRVGRTTKINTDILKRFTW